MPGTTGGPWRAAFYSTSKAQREEMKRLIGHEPVRTLTNDGGVPIMGVDEDGDPIRVGVADLQRQDVKRGKAWCAEDEKRDANARVMAASFRMLAALKQIRDDRNAVGDDEQVPEALNINEHWDEIDAVIAEAERTSADDE